MTAHWPAAIMVLATLALGGCGAKPISTLVHPEAALVRIHSTAAEGTPAVEGLGFLVSADGLVVTCARVADGTREVTVSTADGKTLHGQVLQEDPDAGVAILKVAGKDFPNLGLYDADIAPGMHVRVAGNGGIVHGVFDHWENFGRDIDFTARVSPGDCGAPLLADDGRVIGVVQGHAEGRVAESRAAPAWHVLRMMPNLHAPSSAP